MFKYSINDLTKAINEKLIKQVFIKRWNLVSIFAQSTFVMIDSSSLSSEMSFAALICISVNKYLLPKMKNYWLKNLEK